MTDPTYGSTANTGGSATDQVNDQVRGKAQLAQDQARGALGQARGRLRDQVDQRSTQAGDQVQSAAQDVRSVAEQLRGQGKDTPARMAEQLADRAESFGSYLRDADGERLLGDVEAFARRQPWLVAAGGLALGFAASRFLKASSSRRYQTGYQSSGDGGGDDRSYATSPYDTRTSYDTGTSSTPGARYETQVPVVGTYDPDPVQGEPLGDVYDERRS
jgi:uncharacterized protein YjbJ (UPF0337 family)